MRIATWNINSIRARTQQMADWLDQAQPDVLCMQELKCLDDQFPLEVFSTRGYEVATFGQKTYNGVGIASKHPITNIERKLPWPDDDGARGIAATIDGLRIVSLYIPNGRSVGSDAYIHKLEWLVWLRQWLADQIKAGCHVVAAGDYNIAPDDLDLYDPVGWHEKVHTSTPEREAFRRLLALGLVDALRHVEPDAPKRYTWWDYRAGAFRRDMGLRIDHFLVSQTIANRIESVEIDRPARKAEGASDHAPVILTLKDA